MGARPSLPPADCCPNMDVIGGDRRPREVDVFSVFTRYRIVIQSSPGIKQTRLIRRVGGHTIHV